MGAPDSKEPREPRILITYKGRRYDVTQSELWKDGFHMGLHKAGHDLTHELAAAPHGEEVFKGLAIVEEEARDPAEGSDPMDRLRKLYYKFHPHPILIHLPLGSISLSLILELIFLFTKDGSFETAAFYALFFGWFGLLSAILSGLLSWWINYELAWTSIFRKKLTLSLCLLVVCGLTVAVRLYDPGVAHQAGFSFFLYHLLFFTCPPLAFGLGYYGGRITWP